MLTNNSLVIKVLKSQDELYPNINYTNTLSCTLLLTEENTLYKTVQKYNFIIQLHIVNNYNLERKMGFFLVESLKKKRKRKKTTEIYKCLQPFFYWNVQI
ncbi:hypothetical protein EGW08_017814 [Elysia chlorotica]|uniref:Uncharacterized protein n=1 Tax=Elysia chlorotica TaxID=188477 RepID=A0A3S0ZAF9_ELYCH|nr:hypothetical protein EGW08_017814 [Elysia chlorotica]